MFARTGRDFAFLYRSEQGVVDAATWTRASLPLAALFAVTTAVWLALKPFASRGLDQRGFFDPLALAANVYVLLYALATILLTISWVNLTAKRFRDRGRAPPVGLAGVLPLVVLLDGALRWLQPQLAGAFAHGWLYLGDACVVAALAWTVAECADWLAVRR